MTLTSHELSILIVDDDLINRNNMMTQLNLLLPNITYAEAGNGQMAVDLVEAEIKNGQRNFAIIMMDFCMPIMNGERATQRIRELELASGLAESNCAYIVTWSTSKSQPYVGANAVLHKPIIRTELADLLKNYLG